MDIKQRIAAHILNIIDRGNMANKSLWTTAARGGFPVNTKTGRYFRGINALQLWFRAAKQGYKTNIWLSYSQLRGLNIRVNEGERGVLCCYFDRAGVCRPFFAFNIDQLQDVPQELTVYPTTKMNMNPIAEGEQTLELYAHSLKALRGDTDRLFKVVDFLLVQAAKAEAAHWM